MYSLIGWCGMILVMESNWWDWTFQNQGEILLNCYIWIMKYIHVKILIYLVVERGAERKMSTNQTAAWKVLHNGYVATTTTSSPSSSSSPLLKCHSHTLTAQFFSSNVSLILFFFLFSSLQPPTTRSSSSWPKLFQLHLLLPKDQLRSRRSSIDRMRNCGIISFCGGFLDP